MSPGDISQGDFMQEESRPLMLDTRKLVVGGGSGQEVTESKRLQLDDRDMISNLPQDLIQCIIKRLSIHDAVRTSVLSKEWRYTWGMNTQLVLDKLFFSRLTTNIDEDAQQSAFSRAVEKIFLGHVDDILRFVLYMPPKLDQCPVALWIEILSKKGIKYLSLNNYENNAYEIPLCLFDCVELIILHLDTWILNAPQTCNGFANLLQVELRNITFNADISFGTQLRCLILEYCTGILHLSGQFTIGNNLTDVFISLAQKEQIDWRWFECTPQLRILGLAFTSVKNFNRKEPINMIKFLTKFPNIRAFFTTGFTLEVCHRDLTIHGLSIKVENLKELLLDQLGSQTSCQFSYALDVMRCFPNLQRLRIILVDDESINHIFLACELGFEDYKDILLDQLHTVDIEGVVASNYVFSLVEILLASSPSLKEMSLFCSRKVTDPSEKLKIEQDLQKLPRRSLAAEVFLWD